MEPEFTISEDILDAAVAATPESIATSANEDIIHVGNGLMEQINNTTAIASSPLDVVADVTIVSDDTAVASQVEVASEENSKETASEIKEEVEEVNPVTARFSGASWFKKFQELDIVLAGVGGIGSYVAFMLSRMQPAYLTLIDPDRVELVNLAGQLFSSGNIGQYKVEAVANFVRDYSQYYSICTSHEVFDEENRMLAPVMICGFDNMEARKEFFKAWEAQLGNSVNPSEALFIDGRLSAEAFQVITIQGDDKSAIERYKREFLFTDNEADATVCSYKQTTYMAAMIASTILNTLTNWVATQAGEWRPVPFFIEYDATIVNFKTEM